MNPIDRLKNEAMSSKKSKFNREKQSEYIDLFIQLSKKLNNNLILKGNILLNELLRDKARGTKDLDMDIVNVELLNDVVNPELVKFAESSISRGLASYYRVSELTDRTSGGIKIYNSSDEVEYGVDIGLCKTTSVFGRAIYKIKGVDIIGSSLEKIVADKCLATLSYRRFRRMKDFYDLYIICKSNMEIDYKIVLDLMIDLEGLDVVTDKIDVIPFSLEILNQCNQAWSKFTAISFDGAAFDYIDFPIIIDEVSGMYTGLKQERNKLNDI